MFIGPDFDVDAQVRRSWAPSASPTPTPCRPRALREAAESGHVLATNVQQYLWANVRAAHTDPHFDAHHNLLCVLVGRKRVSAGPPSLATVLPALPLSSQSSNHAATGASLSALDRPEVVHFDLGPGCARAPPPPPHPTHTPLTVCTSQPFSSFLRAGGTRCAPRPAPSPSTTGGTGCALQPRPRPPHSTPTWLARCWNSSRVRTRRARCDGRQRQRWRRQLPMDGGAQHGAGSGGGREMVRAPCSQR